MALWTPANLSNLDWWFDASDASTIVTDANGILGWGDKTGSGIDLYQTSPDAQPQLVEGVQNGLPIVRFAPRDSLLWSQARQAMNKTFVFVFKAAYAGAGTFGGKILGSGDGIREIKQNGLTIYSYSASWGGTGTYTTSLPFSYQAFNLYQSGTNDPLTQFINGLQDSLSPARVNTDSPFSYQTLPGNPVIFAGDLAEILLLDGEPTEDDRQKLEGYLAHKWGTTSLLPPLHPYRDSAPVTELIVPVSVPNAPDGARYRISNQSRSNAEIANGIVSGGAGISTTFIADDASVPHVEGDTIHVDVTYPVSTTAYLPSRVLGQASASGVSGFVAQTDDEIYNFHGIDGSALTLFEADFVDDEIDIIVSQNFVGAAFYAFYVHSLTLEAGIREWLGAITAIDNANFRVNTAVMSIKLDNDTANNVWQTDNVRIFRDDGARPVKHPTTGGGGIDVNWRSQVYTTVVTTSDGVVTGDISQVPAAVQSGLTAQGYTAERAEEISDIKNNITTSTEEITSSISNIQVGSLIGSKSKTDR